MAVAAINPVGTNDTLWNPKIAAKAKTVAVPPVLPYPLLSRRSGGASGARFFSQRSHHHRISALRASSAASIATGKGSANSHTGQGRAAVPNRRWPQGV